MRIEAKRKDRSDYSRGECHGSHHDTARDSDTPYFDYTSFLERAGFLCRVVFSQREAVSGRLTDIDPKEEKRADESNASHSPLDGKQRPENARVVELPHPQPLLQQLRDHQQGDNEQDRKHHRCYEILLHRNASSGWGEPKTSPGSEGGWPGLAFRYLDIWVWCTITVSGTTNVAIVIVVEPGSKGPWFYFQSNSSTVHHNGVPWRRHNRGRSTHLPRGSVRKSKRTLADGLVIHPRAIDKCFNHKGVLFHLLFVFVTWRALFSLVLWLALISASARPTESRITPSSAAFSDRLAS